MCAIVILHASKAFDGMPEFVTRVGIVRGSGKRALELAARPLEIALNAEGYEVAQVEFYRDPLGQLLDSESSAFLLALPGVGKCAS